MLWVLVLVFVATGHAAEVSLVDQIRPILAQEPSLVRTVTESLECEPAGHSPRLAEAEPVPPPLRGQPIGPYSLWCKPRGTPGDSTFVLLISTAVSYRDAQGRDCPLAQAARLTETLVAARQLPLEPVDPALLGDWEMTSAAGAVAQFYEAARWRFLPGRRSIMEIKTREGPSRIEGYFDLRKGDLRIGDRSRNTYQSFRYRLEGNTLTAEARDGEALFVRFSFRRAQ